MSETETIDSPSDDVRAAISQLQNPDVATAPEPEEPELPLEAEPEEKPDRARDGRGRFIVPPKAKDTSVQPDSKPVADAAPVVEQPQAAALAPPARLSKEAKAIWNSVPPAIQAEWAKMEADTQKGVEKLKSEHQQALQNWQQLEGIIAPRRDYYKRFGFTNDVQAINHLLTISDSLERDPAGTIAFLAQHYRVPFQGLNGAQPQGAQPQLQPQLQQPQVDYRAAIREEIGLANAASEIESFAANPAYPHFQTVRPMMSHLLQTEQAKTLEEAYERAIWADPQLRQERMEQEAAEKAKEAEAQRAKLEAKKRAANASLSGAPHGATPAKRQNGSRPTNAHDDAVDDVRAAIASLS